MNPPLSRFLVALALLLLARPAGAQPLPPGTPDNKQAPNLAPVLPLGMQRGTSLELTLTGTNLAGPVGVLTSFPAKVTIPTDANNGKDNAKLRVRLEVPADAPLGFHVIRLATTRGMSVGRLFCIDDLPTVKEVDTNRSLKTAQVVPVPCVVSGRADAEMTDYFKFKVKAGQRLSFEVLGRRLGSVFDPEITLLSDKGRELPGGYSNDAPGQQTDPRLSYTFKEAGEYVVAIRDVSYKGATDFNYRLRIGEFPLATSTLPVAAKRGSKVQVKFAGPEVTGVAPVEIAVPSDPLIEAVQVAPRGPSGLHGWPVTLAISEHDEVVESEPNNEPAKANRIPVPGGVTGRFETAEDVDHFVFAAQKGKRYTIEAHTSEHHLPTEVDLQILDAKGKKLAESDPKTNISRVTITAAADGDLTVVARHLHNWHGPEEVYRLTVDTAEPSFTVSVPVDRLDLSAGGTISMPLLVTRAGYAGPIEVSVVGKGLSGSGTIKAGKAPPKGAAGTVLIKAADDAPLGPMVFRMQAKAMIGGKAQVKWVSVRPGLARNMGNLPVPPRSLWYDIGATIRERPPLKVAATFDAPFAQPGKPITATLKVERLPGFTGEVLLTAEGLPPGVVVKPAKLSPKDSVGKVTLTIPPKVKFGKFLVTFVGRAKHGGNDVAARAAPVALVLKK